VLIFGILKASKFKAITHILGWCRQSENGTVGTMPLQGS